MEHLFAYGTLMCVDIMREVAGCDLSDLQGTLRGYRRRAVKGEHYPAVVLDEQSSVEGVIYLDVPESAWRRLDAFEGEMYARQAVAVELRDGTPMLAGTYVLKPAFLNRLGPSDWDLTTFLRDGKASFQRNYRGYRSL
jgi:gamma-glutamylcyclotransferase (GGCT)/AIG2-like uncharacterized protein YtfP